MNCSSELSISIFGYFLPSNGREVMSNRLVRTVSKCGRTVFVEPPNPTHPAVSFFSRAVITNGTVHVSGTGAGTNPDGTPRRGTAAQETVWAMENLKFILRECGSDLESVFRVTMLISDKAHYGPCNQAYLNGGFFDKHKMPMRTTTMWGYDGDMKVGFACEAYVNNSDESGSPRGSKL